jgi:hypothetical protein
MYESILSVDFQIFTTPCVAHVYCFVYVRERNFSAQNQEKAVVVSAIV